jgi:NAD(P)-dependent dehydrogenase (short-subunit alcohol dehydrogenase family)
VGLRFDFGHNAAVVGAGGAIGSAICRAYAEAGATVTALDVDLGAAERATAGLPPGASSRALPMDVTDDVDVARAAADTMDGRRIDSVVYAAGVAPTFEVLDFEWDVYHHTLAVNLHGALRVAQAFVRPMLAAGVGGCFTFLSSTAGKRGEAGAAAYCASKFAIEGVVQCFAAEVGAHGIRVNAICPGDVDTPMLRKVAAAQAAREGSAAEVVLASYARRSACGRLVTPAEVAAVAIWLASPLAAGVTGESVNVDAGLLTG